MSSFDSDISQANSHHYSLDFSNVTYASSISIFPLNDRWILSIFILCLFGILCTIIISFLFLCLSLRRLNGHFLLTNLFICFSVCFIYTIIILFLIRANDLFCGLREFLSQFAYALLYSALLCRYIMQWLGSRILSQRTKQLTSLLIYLLLIFTQIPIGILWWYFTIPRICQQRDMNVLLSSSNIPKFILNFRQSNYQSIEKSCSNRCIIDYRFYATFTYTILELFFCTIISMCLFLCGICNRNRSEEDKTKTISINGNNTILTFLNMFAFVLIDLVWLSWTLIYYFTHPFFIFPSLTIGMFMIATICLLFILLPQVYYYSKLKVNDINMYKTKTTIQPTTLYRNKLAAVDDVNDQDLLLANKLDYKLNNQKKKQQTLSNGSDLSCELGMSGTFLPITRTPKGPFKVTTADKSTPVEKLDKLIYGDQQNAETINTDNQNATVTHHDRPNKSSVDTKIQQEQRLQTPMTNLQRQSTSSSIASDFVTPVMSPGAIHRSDVYRNPSSDMNTPSSMYYAAYPSTRRDETIIPILCSSERPRTSTPIHKRILVNSLTSSVPPTRRIHSGTDLRYNRPTYHPMYASPSSVAASYYSPQSQQYLFVDPYRTVPTRVGGSSWQSVLLQPNSMSYRYPYTNRRFHTDYRSLSQRLWDIDSGDDEDDVEEDIVKVAGRVTPPKNHLNAYHSNHFETENDNLLHIDDDVEDDEDDSYRKRYAHV